MAGSGILAAHCMLQRVVVSCGVGAVYVMAGELSVDTQDWVGPGDAVESKALYTRQ